jgi:hypothetical protein
MNQSNGLHYRDEIIQHFRDGTPWSAAARAHYAGCLECMTEVTAVLAQQADAMKETRGNSATPAPELPEAAQRALQHGRQVLAREFGIKTRKDAESNLDA